jgi:hypothetical protein
MNKARRNSLFIELLSEELELISNAVGVATVATAEQIMTVVVDTVPLFSGGVLHDESLLLKAPTDVGVELLEPVLEFGVTVRILVDLVDRIYQVIERSAVGETLKEGLHIS